MKKSTDGGGPGTRHDEGWDESVLVWNATVARIRARASEPDTTDARGSDAWRREARYRGARTARPACFGPGVPR
jgi:hypothetical protein